jgi:hypothetical protein
MNYFLLVSDDRGVLTGARVGPYDKRTVVGMRIKKLLHNDQMLISDSGAQISVGDLVHRRTRPEQSTPSVAPDSVSNLMPTFTVSHVVPLDYIASAHDLRGLGEVRLQFDVLRVVGPVRKGFSEKDARIKIELERIVNIHLNGDRVDMLLLGIDGPGTPLQTFAMEFMDGGKAREFQSALPNRVKTLPWPKPPARIGRKVMIWTGFALVFLAAAAGVGRLLAR